MLEKPQIINEIPKENNKKLTKLFHSRNSTKKELNNDIEALANSSSNTLTNIYQSVQKSILFQKPHTQILNEKKPINNYHHIPKKGVSFKEPFLNIVEVESLKEFNLKMTYNDYEEGQDEVINTTKECCSRIKLCILF